MYHMSQHGRTVCVYKTSGTVSGKAGPVRNLLNTPSFFVCSKRYICIWNMNGINLYIVLSRMFPYNNFAADQGIPEVTLNHWLNECKFLSENNMKKTMRKITGMLLGLSCAAMLGCSNTGGKTDVSNSKYVGTWKVTSAEAIGESVSAEEMFKDGDVTLELNADGACKLTYTEGPTACTWTETSDGVKTEGDVSMTLKEEGTGLVGDIFVVKLHFEKSE